MNYRSVRGSSRYKRITRLSPGVPGPVRLLCVSTRSGLGPRRKAVAPIARTGHSN